jgi:O-antigen/teichoic acid export membrane protein
MFLGPLIVLPFSTNIVPAVSAVVIGRIAGGVAHLILCLVIVPVLRREIQISTAAVGSLLRFGTWMTVSNVVGPLMVYLDRFLIGAILSIAAVAYYSTPYDMVARLWVIPTALAGVLFPAFATSAASDVDKAAILFSRAAKFVLIALFPLTLVIVAFSREGLDLWLGSEFGENSTKVLQILAIGVLINGLAHIPFALVQGFGRADLTAKLHLFEAPLYLVGVWWAIRSYGIEGAAIVWLLRVAFDTVFLFWLADQLLVSSTRVLSRGGVAMIATVCTIGISAVIPGTTFKMAYVAIALALFLATIWKLMLSSAERDMVRRVCGIRK